MTQRHGPRGRAACGRTARRELVENEIYEQATRLFAERGFAGTSLQDIADAMGITRPALYYYVKSKDELLAKLVTEITDGPGEPTSRAVAARTDLDAVGKLRAIARLIVGPAHHPTRPVPAAHPLRGRAARPSSPHAHDRQPPGRAQGRSPA